MSKYYIQINKDGRPLEGGVVSKRKPKYGLYQTIESWCCNTVVINFNNNGTVYVPETVVEGDSVSVNLAYKKAGDATETYVYSDIYVQGNISWTLNDFVRVLNNNFSTFGHWEKDPVVGIKLVETPFTSAFYINVHSWYD